MSKRKDFEEFCKRTRPPLSVARDIWMHGKGNYTNIETRGAWKAWQYLDKQYNPWPKGCKSVNHDQ